MDIRRLLHNPDDGGWYVIGETKSEAEMNDFRRSLKRNAIINTHLVNCTMTHENLGAAAANVNAGAEHKMKVQWTKCTSALCHPKTADGSKPRACPVQVRMSTCQLTHAGVICQAYQHLSDEHDSAEPVQTSVTDDMKVYIVQMLQANPDVKPMIIYKELTALHEQGVFGDDLMPTKIQLRNALTYLRSRKLKGAAASAGDSPGAGSATGGGSGTPTKARKRRYDSFSDGSESPPLEEHRLPE